VVLGEVTQQRVFGALGLVKSRRLSAQPPGGVFCGCGSLDVMLYHATEAFCNSVMYSHLHLLLC